MVALRQSSVSEHDIVHALALFDPVWDSLTPREQARIVHLLIERIDYDGAAGNVSITFRPTGIQSLAQHHSTEDAA